MTAAVRVTPSGVPVRLGDENTVKLWRALIVLGTARFLMVLDTSVLNVSIRTGRSKPPGTGAAPAAARGSTHVDANRDGSR
ncbi:hypothetical protein PV367_12305 [Streptomyces europaeiscabiei]|uniref:Uncharacterized protein n=1 Tax=Streptomyces europaeiscabiei TaxID=146819 RepID=A0AAJ2UL43_9ACTN|nr:hypothetical protein [Streptomyces europaeiscabiei]MDX3130559.1 hypothetical protein [Streptomyces europaeiscabiei]